MALAGSLRKASYNRAALEALRRLAPSHVEITVGEIGDLPLFNPDREDETIAAVDRLKSQLRHSCGLILASPEYAHGISGVMKNALDWLVSGDEFPYVPIMLVNTSPRSRHAQEALTEVLRTMSGHLVEAAHVSVPLLGSELDHEGVLENPELVRAMEAGVLALCVEIEKLEHAREAGERCGPHSPRPVPL